MKIIIEIGDASTKAEIRRELEFFLEIAKSIEPPIKLNGVFVPLDYDTKVNQLQEQECFSSLRGNNDVKVQVLAKIVDRLEETYIVLSPQVYHQAFDSMNRCFFLTHEFAHLMNRNRFPKLENESFAFNNYIPNLYYMYDEYYSDRFAYRITENIFSPTDSWIRFTKDIYLHYFRIATSPNYYNFIQTQIESFRTHGNVEELWYSVQKSISVITSSTTHGYAYLHEYPQKCNIDNLPKSSFVNEKTEDLMNYLRTKYEDKEINLCDGLEVVENYFKNFGFIFEDRDRGGYIRVIDI